MIILYQYEVRIQPRIDVKSQMTYLTLHPKTARGARESLGSRKLEFLHKGSRGMETKTKLMPALN